MQLQLASQWEIPRVSDRRFILKSFEKQLIRNRRIIVIGDFNIMQAIYDILKIRSYKLHRVIYAGECVFNERSTEHHGS